MFSITEDLYIFTNGPRRSFAAFSIRVFVLLSNSVRKAYSGSVDQDPHSIPCIKPLKSCQDFLRLPDEYVVMLIIEYQHWSKAHCCITTL